MRRALAKRGVAPGTPEAGKWASVSMAQTPARDGSCAVQLTASKHLSDAQLLDNLADKSRRASKLMAELLALLAEVDERRLYATLGFPSLFQFCRERLGFSEDEAAKRIYAARTARKHPAVFELVASGQITLTSVTLLAPHLDKGDGDALIAAAIGKSKREVEEQIAAHYPQRDAPTRLRQLPERGAPHARDSAGGHAAALPTFVPPMPLLPTPAPTPTVASAGADACVKPTTSTASVAQTPSAAPPAAPPPATPRATPAVFAPLSAERYKLQVTLSRDAKEHLLRAQELMRHQNPKGDLALVIERALALLCEHLESRKFGRCKRPRRAADACASENTPAHTDARVSEHAPEHGVAHTPLPAGADTSTASTNSSVNAPAPHDATSAQVPEHEPPSENAAQAPDGAEQGETRATSDALASKRTIPRAVRRAVAERDGCRCAYVGPNGLRCSARTMLEFHHRTPYALGGQTTVENCELRCRAHNDLAARIDFGEAHMAACKRKRNEEPDDSTTAAHGLRRDTAAR